MKLKDKTDKFGVTTITCKAKARESFDSFAASSFSLGKKWFLPFKYEAKKKTTTLKFSVNNLISLEEFFTYALLREQFAEFLKSLSTFLTYMREHSVQNEYVLFDTKFVLINKEDMQLKFVYLPFKTPEYQSKPLYDFLIEVGEKLQLANEAADGHLLQRYRDFFVLRELFSVTKFKDMVDSIYAETFTDRAVDEVLAPKTADLKLDSYESLGAKKDVFVEVAPALGNRGAAVQNPKNCGFVRTATGQRLIFSEFPTIIGSGEQAQMRIEDVSSISRKHAKVDLDDGVFTICDLGSTNGTHLNGRKLPANRDFALKEGDSIKLANEPFTVELW